MEMRAVFGNQLKMLMEKDENIVVVDSDLARANGTLFLREHFPERAIDVGVAEQNMASVGAGLASYGFKPFITSFTPFASRRICDQISISIAYAKRNVKIVGTDPGIYAELNGGTHMSFEDIGVLRSIPTMVIFEPADAIQLEKAMPVIADYEGPLYLRLFRKEAPAVFKEDYVFDLFKADVIKEGADVTILATGTILYDACLAVAQLAEEGIQAELINVHTIKPIDTETILQSVGKTGCVLTCENHNIIGGLRSAVAEILVEQDPVPLKCIGIKDQFGQVGKVEPLKDYYGLTPEHIVAKAKEVLALKK